MRKFFKYLLSYKNPFVSDLMDAIKRKDKELQSMEDLVNSQRKLIAAYEKQIKDLKQQIALTYN